MTTSSLILREAVLEFRARAIPKSSILKILAEVARLAPHHELCESVRLMLNIDPVEALRAVAHYHTHNSGDRRARGSMDNLWKPQWGLDSALAALAALDDDAPVDLYTHALAWAGRSTSPFAAPITARVLEQPRLAELHPPAAATLLAIVRRYMRRSPHSPLGPVADQFIDRSLAAAARAYTVHRQFDVLIAAACMSAHPGPELDALLNDEENGLLRRLWTLPARTDREPIPDLLLRWLGNPRLSTAVIRRLPDLRRGELLERAYSHWHWLLTPRRRQALSAADRPARALPHAGAFLTLAPAAQRGVVASIRATPLSTSARAQKLSECVTLPNPLARLAALRELSRLPLARVGDEIALFASDTHSAVRRFARRLLTSSSDGRPAPQRIASLLEHKPARRHTAILAADHRHTAAAIRDSLSSLAPPSPLDLLSLIGALPPDAFFEPHLCRYAKDPDARIAATALSLLGRLDSPRVQEILRHSLSHPDPRVRANAIDALRRLRSTEPLLLQALNSPVARERANSIVAASPLDPASARAALRDLLASTDPMNRRSAVWAGRRIGAWADLAHAARTERDAIVLRRLRQALAVADASQPALDHDSLEGRSWAA